MNASRAAGTHLEDHTGRKNQAHQIGKCTAGYTDGIASRPSLDCDPRTGWGMRREAHPRRDPKNSRHSFNSLLSCHSHDKLWRRSDSSVHTTHTPSYPGHGCLCNQNEVFLRRQLNAIREPQLVQQNLDFFRLGVILQQAGEGPTPQSQGGRPETSRGLGEGKVTQPPTGVIKPMSGVYMDLVPSWLVRALPVHTRSCITLLTRELGQHREG